MTKEEMEEGFKQGRVLVQEEWSTPEEVKAIDELIAEGKAEVVEDWEYRDGFQCERRVVKGIKQ